MIAKDDDEGSHGDGKSKLKTRLIKTGIHLGACTLHALAKKNNQSHFTLFIVFLDRSFSLSFSFSLFLSLCFSLSLSLSLSLLPLALLSSLFSLLSSLLLCPLSLFSILSSLLAEYFLLSLSLSITKLQY